MEKGNGETDTHIANQTADFASVVEIDVVLKNKAWWGAERLSWEIFNFC